ncbi:MAG: permease [Candidatus Eisenbacteria bacterium]
MASRSEWRTLILMIAGFFFLYFLPFESLHLHRVLTEALGLTVWYARHHLILCLIPAFFIAGAICCFVSQASVLRYLGPKANKVLAYGVASVSGSVLAVCSCTVLPLFAGIYKRGAGLGPACAFLYSGPAINILAIVLTAKVLGPRIGIARAVGAIGFCIIIGLLMHLIFRKEELRKAEAFDVDMPPEPSRPLWKTAAYFASMVAILVFANWGRSEGAGTAWNAIFSAKWIITGGVSAMFGLILVFWMGLRARHILIAAIPVVVLALVFRGNHLIPFSAGVVAVSIALSRGNAESREWLLSTWIFAKQMLPLLLLGVVIAGALLGRPGHEALIPSRWIAGVVGGNSLQANLIASVAGAFMYFATLTEVPILQGLLGAGMGKGPALALLLAGPALSLPNMLVIRSIMGTKRTIVFIGLICIMATLSGLIFGTFWG